MNGKKILKRKREKRAREIAADKMRMVFSAAVHPDTHTAEANPVWAETKLRAHSAGGTIRFAT